MAIVVFKIADGSAVSYIPDSLTIAQAQANGQLADNATLASNGLSAIDGQPVLDTTHTWDVASKTVLVVAARKSVVSLLVFWQRFTAAERESLEGAYLTGTQGVKNAIAAFKTYLQAAGCADCNDTYIQTKVQQMETVGIIAAGRASQILV